MLAEQINMVQNGNNDELVALIEKFDRLLKKYARLLRYEDALNDLQLDFIVLIKNIRLERLQYCNDGVLVNYIVRAVKNSYISHSKRAGAVDHTEIGFSDLSEEQMYMVEGQNSVSGTDDFQELMAHIPRGTLTDRETLIIIREFYMGMSSAEISNDLKVSRQSINQTKQKALKKLKRAIEEEVAYAG